MDTPKKIALVAHDDKKQDLLEWARYNKNLLIHHELYATGTTGKLLEQELGIEINKLQSGPLGGDQQIGAKIAAGDLDERGGQENHRHLPAGGGRAEDLRRRRR